MSWKEESLLVGEPWGGKRRAISPGEAQQPGSGEGFVYHEGGESHTKPRQGTALPALQPSPRTELLCRRKLVF